MGEELGEEEAKTHERALNRIADRESRRILRAMAAGHTPDIVDRILLRMARKNQVGTPPKMAKRARR